MYLFSLLTVSLKLIFVCLTDVNVNENVIGWQKAHLNLCKWITLVLTFDFSIFSFTFGHFNSTTRSTAEFLKVYVIAETFLIICNAGCCMLFKLYQSCIFIYGSGYSFIQFQKRIDKKYFQVLLNQVKS